MAQVQLSYELDMEPASVWLTVTPNQAAKASIPYVQELGDFISHEKYYTRREGLPSYLIKYTLSGEGLLEYGGQAYLSQPGQAFWIDCQAPQYYHPTARLKEWRILWVHFYGPSCAQYYDLFRMQNGGAPVVTLPPNTEVPAMLRQLMELYQPGENSLSTDVYAASLLTAVMTQCILGASAPLDFGAVPDAIRDARAYLFANFSQRVTLDDLAEKYSMNKYYFQKQFKRYTGFTPNEFLISTRLNRAKELLRTTSRSINQIACDVGVENASHFINLFRRHEGVTPYAFRQSWYRQ